MGADGHIVIFDWQKMVDHFGEDKADQLAHGCWNAYRDSLATPSGPIEVVHYYWGGNFDFSPYQGIYVDAPSWDAWFLIMEHTPNRWTLEELREAWNWMLANAQIGEWEVWT